jgi:hypothetical protein
LVFDFGHSRLELNNQLTAYRRGYDVLLLAEKGAGEAIGLELSNDAVSMPILHSTLTLAIVSGHGIRHLEHICHTELNMTAAL